MKSIYTIRFSDGLLMKFDGSTWSVVGSYAPANYLQTYYGSNLGSLFVYRGKMYARYVCSDPNTGQPQYVISQYNGTDMVELLTYDWPTENDEIIWTNVFSYKGNACWLDMFCRGSSTDQFYYCCLSITPSGTLSFTRTLANLGTLPSPQSQGDGSSYFNWRDSGRSSHNSTLPKVYPYRDRLMFLPPVAHNSNGPDNAYWAYTASLDVDSTGNFTFAPFLTVNTNQRILGIRTNGDDSFRLSNQVAIDQIYVTQLPYENYLYGITASGKFNRLDPDDGTTSLIYDLGVDSNFLLENGQTYTTSSSDPNWTLHWSNGSDPGNLTNQWVNWAGGCNLKVQIQNLNGVPNSTKLCYAHVEGGNNYMTLIDAITGAIIPSQPSGTQLLAWWTFAGLSAGNSDPEFHLQSIHSWLWNGKMYIMRVHGRSPNNQSQLSAPPTCLIVYDFVNTPLIYKFYINGNPFQINSCVFEFEETAGIMHVMGYDYIQQGVRMYNFTISSQIPGFTDMGTIYPRSSNQFTNADQLGQSPGQIITFDTGDVTAQYISRTLNDTAKTISMAYELYGANSDTATIEVEYQTGTAEGGWVSCTSMAGQGDGKVNLASTPSGTAHNFVHDISTDFGGDYVGTIQHRIRIVSQTRN
jgi:hypothetical protein